MGNRNLNAKNSEILAIGLMSGTSLDGVDAAIIQTDGHNVKRFGKAFHLPYTKEQQDLLLDALAQSKKVGAPTTTSNSIVAAEGLINDLHFDAVMKVIEINELEKQDVAVVGFHGQTLLHNPDENWSWQIGDGRELAQRLGISVVNDFRRFDVENGGQGAPLVPIYHRALLPDQINNYPIALLNIAFRFFLKELYELLF